MFIPGVSTKISYRTNLLSFLYKNSLYYRKQPCVGVLCETQLVGVIHYQASNLQRNQVDVAIMDFSKAFNVVHHGKLLEKLFFYEINGQTLFLVIVLSVV